MTKNTWKPGSLFVLFIVIIQATTQKWHWLSHILSTYHYLPNCCFTTYNFIPETYSIINKVISSDKPVRWKFQNFCNPDRHHHLAGCICQRARRLSRIRLYRQFLPDYLITYCKNFIMAFPLQLIIVGPLARLIFRTLFLKLKRWKLRTKFRMKMRGLWKRRCNGGF